MENIKIYEKFELVDIDSIIPDPENAKKHSSKDIEEKKASLRLHGFVKPIAVTESSRVISAGSGMYMAAKSLGLKKVPVIFTDHSTLRAKSFGLADNLLSDNSQYDLEQFNRSIKELADFDKDIDWNALAFSESDINLLLASMNSEITDSASPQNTNEDAPQEFDESSQPARPIKLSKGQREIFDIALKSLRKKWEDDKISEGKCIELICGDFIAGN